MKQTARISKLFNDLYDDSPWLGVNWLETLNNISAEQASKRIAEGRNTIWEITNHVIQWRLNVLRRVQGESIVSPDHNYILPVEAVSETDWKNTLEELAVSQQKWLDFLKNFDENQFSKIYPNNQMTYYEHIHGILQHDSYHLGQVVLLAKML
ncbi:MAG TPA: DinB family protein [Flavobacteriaceae bacterium]|nr:DinB family protein [Flavobacteriaceae bacterium]